VLWAILFGLIVSNTIGVPALFRPGVATYEFWLKAGIVLLGGRFLLGDVMRLGALSLIFVAIELAISIALMTWLGRRFRLSPKLTSLLAIGSSICGVSAITAPKGAIDAEDEDASYAIAAILALGAFSLFAFPFIGHALGMSDRPSVCGPASPSTIPPKPRQPALSTLKPPRNSPSWQRPPQRNDWIRGSRLRALLGAEEPGARDQEQDCIPLAEIS
jgi:integral membrane protein